MADGAVRFISENINTNSVTWTVNTTFPALIGIADNFVVGEF